MDPWTLTSRLLGAAVMASGRPVTALFAVQVVAAAAVHGQGATLPSEIAWTLAPLALGVGFVAALVELLVQHTEGADELLRSLHADKIVAGLAGVPALAMLTLLSTVSADVRERAVAELVARGVPEADAVAWVEDAAEQLVLGVEGELDASPLTIGEGTEDLAEAVRILEASQTPPLHGMGLFGLALALQFAMVWVRGEVRTVAEDLNLERAWAWLETGGIGVGVVLVVFAPTLLLVFAALLAAALAAALLSLRLGEAALDATRRRPCPACTASIRVEAMRCPSCRAAVTPVRLLGGSSGAPSRVAADAPLAS